MTRKIFFLEKNISCARHNISCARLLISCARLLISCAQLNISCAQQIISCAQHNVHINAIGVSYSGHYFDAYSWCYSKTAKTISVYSVCIKKKISTFNYNHMARNDIWKWQEWFLFIISEIDNMQGYELWTLLKRNPCLWLDFFN